MHRLRDIENERIEPGTSRLIKDARQAPDPLAKDRTVTFMVTVFLVWMALVAFGVVGRKTVAGLGRDITAASEGIMASSDDARAP